MRSYYTYLLVAVLPILGACGEGASTDTRTEESGDAIASAASRFGIAPGTIGTLALRGDHIEASFTRSSEARHVAGAVRFGQRAQEPFSVTVGGMSIASELVGAAPSRAEVRAGYVTYADALDGGSWIHRVTEEGTEDFALFAREPVRRELAYRVSLIKGVAGLRLVGRQLEFLDATGTPRLRVAAPYGVDARGQRFEAALTLEGCAYDRDPRAPWGRPVTDPGGATCTVRVQWDAGVRYPAMVDPSWMTTGSLPSSVSWAASQSVQLTSGRILVAEGTGGTGSQLYDWTTDTWAVTGAAENVARIGGSLVSLPGSKALLAAGVIGTNDYNNVSTSTARIYDEGAGTWSATGNTSFAHGNRSSILRLADGRVLLVGGENLTSQSVAIRDTETWDPNTGVWTARGQLTVPRREPHLAQLGNGKVIAVSGSDNPGCATDPTGKSAEAFDPGVNTWSSIAGPSTNHHHGWMVLLPTGKLVAGGNVCGAAIAETYDPVANAWSGAAAVTSGYSEGGTSNALVVGNKVVYSVAGQARTLDLASNGQVSGDAFDGVLPAVPGIAINGLHRLPDGRIFYLAISYVNNGDHRGAYTAIRGCNAHAGTVGGSSATTCAAPSPVCDATNTCVPSLANGQALPANPNGRGPYDGKCRQPDASLLCSSGVCSTTDNACGLSNGEVAVDKNGAPTNNPAVCRSNFISVDGKCGDRNTDPVAGTIASCMVPNPPPAVSDICRSGVCFDHAGAANGADNQCGLPNGEPCAATGSCRTVCVAADGICGLLNGSPCSKAASCRSAVCHSDGACGLPNGQPAGGDPTKCRSGSVDAGGACSATCATDATCGSGTYCEDSTKTCVPAEPNGSKVGPSGTKNTNCDVARGARQCQTLACGADGRCGLPDGVTCAPNAYACRSGRCTAGACGTGCATDSECATGNYCEDSSKSCVPAEPNGSKVGPNGNKNTDCSASRAAAQCASGVCNADGKCGDPDGTACSAPQPCRGGACGGDGLCGTRCAPAGAAGDHQCAPALFCSDGGTCLPDAANGAQPDGKACTRPAQCVSGVCNADGKCGTPAGGACASSLTCRSGTCAGSVCSGGACSQNDQCSVTSYCAIPSGQTSGTCAPKKGNDIACMTASECTSAICNSDGKCGVPKGAPCGSSLICRTEVCDLAAQTCVGCTDNKQCASGKCDVPSGACVKCTSDAQCPSGNYCDAPGKPEASCKGKKANSEACSAKNECKSDICHSDGKCGSPDGVACTVADTCRSAVCKDGVCGGKQTAPTGCKSDSDCAAGQRCNTATGTCSSSGGTPANQGLPGALEGGACSTSGSRESFASGLALLAVMGLASVRRRRPHRP